MGARLVVAFACVLRSGAVDESLAETNAAVTCRGEAATGCASPPHAGVPIFGESEEPTWGVGRSGGRAPTARCSGWTGS